MRGGLPQQQPAFLPLRRPHAVSVIGHHVSERTLPLDLQQLRLMALRAPRQPQLLAPVFGPHGLGSIGPPDAPRGVWFWRSPAVPDLLHPVHHAQTHVAERKALLEASLASAQWHILRTPGLAHGCHLTGGSLLFLSAGSAPSAVHAIQRFARGPHVFAPMVEVVAEGQRAALYAHKGHDAVLPSGGVARRAGTLVKGGREAGQEVLSKVLREVGVSAGRVVAWVLADESPELVGKIGSGSSSVKLTELLPVGQRAGGVLRTAGSPVAIHYEAMPMPWQTTDTQTQRERDRSVCKSESVKQKATFTLHGSSDLFLPQMWHRSDMTHKHASRKKRAWIYNISFRLHSFPYLDMNQIRALASAM